MPLEPGAKVHEFQDLGWRKLVSEHHLLPATTEQLQDLHQCLKFLLRDEYKSPSKWIHLN